MLGEDSHEHSQEEFPVLGNGKSAYADSFRSQLSVWGPFRASDSSDPSEGHDPGCHEFLLREVPLPEVTTQPASDSSLWLDSSGLEVPVAKSPPNSAAERNPGSNADESFHLRNEVDFPPLSVR